MKWRIISRAKKLLYWILKILSIFKISKIVDNFFLLIKIFPLKIIFFFKKP